jgi:monoamine oxidase
VWYANDACDQRARRWIEGAIAAGIKNAFAINAGMREELPEGDETHVSTTPATGPGRTPTA